MFKSVVALSAVATANAAVVAIADLVENADLLVNCVYDTDECVCEQAVVNEADETITLDGQAYVVVADELADCTGETNDTMYAVIDLTSGVFSIDFSQCTAANVSGSAAATAGDTGVTGDCASDNTSTLHLSEAIAIADAAAAVTNVYSCTKLVADECPAEAADVEDNDDCEAVAADADTLNVGDVEYTLVIEVPTDADCADEEKYALLLDAALDGTDYLLYTCAADDTVGAAERITLGCEDADTAFYVSTDDLDETADDEDDEDAEDDESNSVALGAVVAASVTLAACFSTSF